MKFISCILIKTCINYSGSVILQNEYFSYKKKMFQGDQFTFEGKTYILRTANSSEKKRKTEKYLEMAHLLYFSIVITF